MSASFPLIFSAEFRNAEEIKAKIGSLGGAMQNFGEKTEIANQTTVKVERSLKDFVLGTSAAISSVVSLGFQLDDLDKKNLAIEKSKRSLANANEILRDKQNDLNKIIDDGITTGGKYDNALNELQLAKERVLVATTVLEQKEDDLSQVQMGLALQVIPTVISSITLLRGAHAALAVGHVATATTGVAAAGGITSLGVAARLAQLAMGPIGWILLGVGSALAIIATNTFGVRDAMDSWAKSIEKNFPFLKPVFDFFRSIADVISGQTKPAINDLTNNASQNFTILGSDASELSEAYRKAMEEMQKSSEDMPKSIETETKKARKSIQELYEATKGRPTKDDGTIDVQRAYDSLKTPSLNLGVTGIGDMLANPRPKTIQVSPAVAPNYTRGILTGRQGDIYLSNAAGKSNGKIVITIDEQGNLKFKDTLRNLYLNEIEAAY